MTKKCPYEGFYYKMEKGESRNRKVICCNAKIRGPDNNLYECKFKLRKDRIRKNATEEEIKALLKHKHYNQSLDAFIIRTNRDNCLTTDSLTKKLAVFSGKYNISLEASVSNSMKKLLVAAFTLGQQHPTANPQDIIPSLNRKTFTKQLISEGVELFDEIIEKYKQYRFAALAIDAGKLGTKNYLDILLCNALIEIRPILYQSYVNFRGNQESYVAKLKDTITKVKEHGLIVSGTVCDALRVQNSAINEILEENNDFFHFYCGAHSLHNALKDAFRDDGELDHFVSVVETFTILLNKKDVLSQIKLSTPKRCITRWTNMYDICVFVMNHYEKYIQFLNNPDTYELKSIKNTKLLKIIREMLTKVAPLFSVLLFYPNKLSKKLESDRSSCGLVYGFERSLIVTMNQQSAEYPELRKYFEILSEKIELRLSSSEHGMLELIAFLLTPAGREAHQMKIRKETQDARNSFFCEHYNLVSEDDIEKIQYYLSKSNCKDDFQFFKTKLEELELHETQRFQAKKERLSSYQRKNERLIEIQAKKLRNEITEDQFQRIVIDEELQEVINEEPIFPEEEECELYNPQTEDDNDDETVLSLESDPLEDLLESETEEEMAAVRSGNYNPFLGHCYTFDDFGTFILDKSQSMGLDGAKATIAFTKWLQYPSPLSRNIEIQIKQPPYDCWMFLSNIAEFKDLAEFALRLLSIPSSEASVERMFWKQRKILTDERNRTGEKLAFARIVLMTAEE